MPLLVFTALCAMLGMLLQSNFISAFALGSALQISVVAACLIASSNLPMTSSTLSVLVIALFADFNAAGPSGLYALALVLSYLVLVLLVKRFRPQRIFVIMGLCFVAVIAFEALLALFYWMYYDDFAAAPLFLKNALPDAALSTALLPVFAAIVHFFARLWQSRRQSELS